MFEPVRRSSSPRSTPRRSRRSLRTRRSDHRRASTCCSKASRSRTRANPTTSDRRGLLRAACAATPAARSLYRFPFLAPNRKNDWTLIVDVRSLARQDHGGRVAVVAHRRDEDRLRPSRARAPATIGVGAMPGASRARTPSPSRRPRRASRRATRFGATTQASAPSTLADRGELLVSNGAKPGQTLDDEVDVLRLRSPRLRAPSVIARVIASRDAKIICVSLSGATNAVP